jgi:hypothetical protein
MRVSSICLLAVVVFSIGCGPNIETLRTRAAYDFRCADDQLTLTPLGTGTYGVDGCGHRATYVQSATGQWVMNTLDGTLGGKPDSSTK